MHDVVLSSSDDASLLDDETFDLRPALGRRIARDDETFDARARALSPPCARARVGNVNVEDVIELLDSEDEHDGAAEEAEERGDEEAAANEARVEASTRAQVRPSSAQILNVRCDERTGRARAEAEGFPEPDCATKLFSQITCVLDAASFGDGDTSGYGRALKIAFDASRQKSADKVILYAHEKLPLPRSVTWRYHAVSDRAVGGDGWDAADGARAHRAHSARYTAVLMRGENFLNLIENDCAKLKEMVKTFEDHSEHVDDKLCIIVEAPDKYCTSKERRNTDYDNPGAGWSRDGYDTCVAQIAVQYANVVLVALPGMSDCVEHVVTLHTQLARRRHEKALSVTDFLAEKAHEYMNGQKAKKAKHEIIPEDYFMRALTKISGVTAPHARGIVREYKSMAALMAAYDNPMTTLGFKKNLLQDIMPFSRVHDSTGACEPGGKKRFGAVKSERVYEFFKPRSADDDGTEILSRRDATEHDA